MRTLFQAFFFLCLFPCNAEWWRGFSIAFLLSLALAHFLSSYHRIKPAQTTLCINSFTMNVLLPQGQKQSRIANTAQEGMAGSCSTAWPQLSSQMRWYFHPPPSQHHAGAAVSQLSLLDIFLQSYKNWNSGYLLQMTNESIKLSREITQGKKEKKNERKKNPHPPGIRSYLGL